MGLGYNEMYNIVGGISSVFSSKSPTKRLLHINHKEAKRDKMKPLFPVSEYSNWTKENFIIAVLYSHFSKGASSLSSSLAMLKTINRDEVMTFKNEIMYYRKFFKEDLDRILREESDINIAYMTKEYRNKRIKWYTFYFYIVGTNQDIKELESSRVNGLLIRQIKKMLLYVSFSEKSLVEMRDTLNNRITI